MYGMVNLAIQGFIEDRYGEEIWQQVKQQAAPEIDVFLTMEQYPDEITMAMVDAAIDLTGDDSPEMLESIGEYWVEFTLRSGYGDLLRVIGTTLPETLANLDNMHARVGLLFPDLKPPTFWCTDVDEHSLILHYQSDRGGLERMIPGTVRALAEMLNTTASVELIASRSEGAEHNQFRVEFGEVGEA